MSSPPPVCSATLKKLRDKFNKRLSTTVQEENSNRDHFEEVQRREEKAGKEKLSLEQQLGLEKKERRRQMQVRAQGGRAGAGHCICSARWGSDGPAVREKNRERARVQGLMPKYKQTLSHMP